MTQAQGVLERALAAALKAATLAPEDAAVVALARRLAQLIDQERGEDDEAQIVVKLATEYRNVLDRLRLTPAARGAKGGDVRALGSNPLADLRDAARKRRSATGNAPSA